MRSLHFIVLIPVLAGCGHIPGDVWYYVQLFQREHKNVTNEDVDVDGLNVVFTDLPDKTVGTCLTNGTIELDQEYWNDGGEIVREILMFHELGHCVLGQDHRGNSVMQPTLLNPVDYKNKREYYITELMNF